MILVARKRRKRSRAGRHKRKDGHTMQAAAKKAGVAGARALTRGVCKTANVPRMSVIFELLGGNLEFSFPHLTTPSLSSRDTH
jgi:hypothetical protein